MLDVSISRIACGGLTIENVVILVMPGNEWLSEVLGIEMSTAGWDNLVIENMNEGKIESHFHVGGEKVGWM